MRVLIGGEFSGIIRDEFINEGIEAWSCDLLPSESPKGPHIIDDMRRIWTGNLVNIVNPNRSKPFRHRFKKNYFDLLIAHPDCTYLCNSGIRWLYIDGVRYIRDKRGRIVAENSRDKIRWKAMYQAVSFFNDLAHSGIEKICLENPRPHPYAAAIIGEPTQYVQPYNFGERASKETGLWLYNLPPLVGAGKPGPPKNEKQRKEYAKCHYASPGPDRWKERSRTSIGIAKAMAEQWSQL